MQETRREFSPWHSFCRKNLRISVKLHRKLIDFYLHPTKLDTILFSVKVSAPFGLFSADPIDKYPGGV